MLQDKKRDEPQRKKSDFEPDYAESFE
jgi:hypothetical protein